MRHKKYNYLKKKGLAMTTDMIRHPENYKNRVCVAYDANGSAKPYMYVLVGNHDHSNEHDIRRIYAKTVGVDYFDTRVILYSTFVQRTLTGSNCFEFGNKKAELV